MEEIKDAPKKFLDPKLIIPQLNLMPSSIVADFGCGPGYFSIPFAKAVGEDGKVYAFDILPQAIETVSSKARNSGISNLIAARVNLEKEHGSKLESNSVDIVIMKDILFQNNDKGVIIAEAYRILKSGGRVIVVEWKDDDSIVGPAKEVRIKQDALEEMFQAKKFVIEKNIVAGDFHYAFVAIK